MGGGSVVGAFDDDDLAALEPGHAASGGEPEFLCAPNFVEADFNCAWGRAGRELEAAAAAAGEIERNPLFWPFPMPGRPMLPAGEGDGGGRSLGCFDFDPRPPTCVCVWTREGLGLGLAGWVPEVWIGKLGFAVRVVWVAVMAGVVRGQSGSGARDLARPPRPPWSWVWRFGRTGGLGLLSSANGVFW